MFFFWEAYERYTLLMRWIHCSHIFVLLKQAVLGTDLNLNTAQYLMKCLISCTCQIITFSDTGSIKPDETMKRLMKNKKGGWKRSARKQYLPVSYSASSLRATGGCCAFKIAISKLSGSWPQNILFKIAMHTDHSDMGCTGTKQNKKKP